MTGSCDRSSEIREDPDRERLLGAGRERRDDDFVEGEREGEQAAREERRPELREGDKAKRLPGVGAEIRRGLLEERRGASKPGDHVVVDDDDAERRVPDHDRRQPEVDPDRMYEAFSAIPVTIPGSAIGRMTRNEIDSRPKKLMPGDRERRERPEHERDDVATTPP